MENERDHPAQDDLDLIRLSGLRLTSDEKSELEILIRRFAADRALLARRELDDLEPALVFVPPVPGGDLS